MLFKVFLASMAFTASFASAYTKPTGDGPEGNPISAPGLGSIVPVGKPFSVNWVPTTEGTVTLVLLKGPSSNAVAQYAIAESIPNSGSYSWTPKDDLAPGSTGYGIQLIDDATGKYQYTTQFGISNPSYSSSPASSSSSSTTATSKAYAIGAPLTAGPRPTTSSTDSAAWPTTTAASSDDSSVISAAAASTTADDSTSSWTTSVLSTPSAPATTPVAISHSAVSSHAKSSSTSASRTASSTPAAATGGASTLGGSFAGLVFAAGVAVLAL